MPETSAFIRTIPGRYYPIGMIVGSFSSSHSVTFGYMLTAERRGRQREQVVADDADQGG
jgi:hypothetical protein